MTEVALTRKQRLRTLENEIRSGMEEFYYTGMKLKEIRDDQLYVEDGFPPGDVGWRAYCKERWEWSKRHCNQLILSAEYRDKIKSGSNASPEWSHRAVTELTRIPDKRDAAKVAAKVIRAVEQSEKEAAKVPEVKPLKLSASVVRKFVDAELGIDRSAKAKETKQKQEEESKPELHVYLRDMLGRIEGERELLQENVTNEGWKQLAESHPETIKRLIAECEALVDLLRKVFV